MRPVLCLGNVLRDVRKVLREHALVLSGQHYVLIIFKNYELQNNSKINTNISIKLEMIIKYRYDKPG